MSGRGDLGHLSKVWGQDGRLCSRLVILGAQGQGEEERREGIFETSVEISPLQYAAAETNPPTPHESD